MIIPNSSLVSPDQLNPHPHLTLQLVLLTRSRSCFYPACIGVVQKQQGHKVDLATDNAITALQAAERTVCDRE
jgi:hypothetical protein